MNRFIFSLGLFCFLALSGCAPEISPPDVPTFSDHFENEYFSIDVPWGWKAYASASLNGNRHFDFLDPHYPKYRIRIDVAGDSASLQNDTSEVGPWARICMLFTDVFRKDFAVRSRANMKTQINGKPVSIQVLNTDQFSGYVASLSGERGAYNVYYWLWNNFPQETKNRIQQVIFTLKVP